MLNLLSFYQEKGWRWDTSHLTLDANTLDIDV